LWKNGLGEGVEDAAAGDAAVIEDRGTTPPADLGTLTK